MCVWHVVRGDCACLLTKNSDETLAPCQPSCPIRSDRQTTSPPVADNWIDEDACQHVGDIQSNTASSTPQARGFKQFSRNFQHFHARI